MQSITGGNIYRIDDSGQTWAPVFNPPTGAISSDTLLITSPTANAEVHYTTNGNDPTTDDPIIPADGRLQISDGATVKARAFRADLPPSPITSGTFTFQVGALTILPEGVDGRSIPSNTVVTISCPTPNATIYFTTNRTLTTNSTVYTGPFTVSPYITVSAFATAPGFQDSLVASKFYQIEVTANPAFLPFPWAGALTNGDLVSIFCATADAVIHYTIDGTSPTENSPVYTEPFPLTQSATVRAKAIAPGCVPSQTSSASFTVLPPPVQIDTARALADGSIEIRWRTIAGSNYVLQSSADLVSWTDLGNPITGDGSVATATDAAILGPSQQQFYRIVQTQ